MGNTTTGFQIGGADIGLNLVDKSYLIDRYPELYNQYRFAGLWSWGDNTYGQLGDGTSVNKSIPVITVSAGETWKWISSGEFNTAAIKTDGTLWTWGRGFFGANGDGTTTDRSSPVQTVSAGTNWRQLCSGYSNVFAIKTDGTLWGWGWNLYGQLGDGTVTTRSSPVQTVSAGTNWRQVACHTQTAAIKTDGTLWLWGSNSYGALGDGTTTFRSSPVQTISGGTNWKQVTCGYAMTSAIKTDGTLWSWGSNSYAGTLGDGTTVNRSSPVQTISGGTNWKQVSGSSRFSAAAIKTDGTLWLWGWNLYGQLGDGTTVDKSSPVQTISGGTNWKQVSTAGKATTAIKTDGTLWTWGLNTNGDLGNGNTTHKSSPVQTAAGGNNWIQVSGGDTHSGAIKDDSGDLW